MMVEWNDSTEWMNEPIDLIRISVCIQCECLFAQNTYNIYIKNKDFNSEKTNLVESIISYPFKGKKHKWKFKKIKFDVKRKGSNEQDQQL